jgi:hypothetical protein
MAALQVVRRSRVRELVEQPGQPGPEAARSIEAHAIGPPMASADATSSIVIVERRTPSDRWQARLGRPAGDAEHLGDLGQRQVEVEVEDEDDSLLGLEPGQCAVKEVAVRDLPVSSSCRRELQRAELVTSTTRRRRLRARSMQACATRLCSQWSNVRGSRRPGRLRQARISVSWTASSARSGSRRMRRAVASRRRPRRGRARRRRGGRLAVLLHQSLLVHPSPSLPAPPRGRAR